MGSMRWLVLAVLGLGACGGKRESAEPPAKEPGPVATLSDAPVADAAVDANPLLAMFGNPAPAPSNEDMIAKLKQQEATASAEEKALIEKMIAALRELDLAITDAAHEREHEIAGTRQMLEALRGMLDYEKANVATERTLISSYAMVAYQVENMGIADAVDAGAIRREALERGRALVKAFPKDARAWKLLGWLEGQLDDDHGSSLPAMRAYRTCAGLDPTIAECAQLLADYRSRWVEPYCPAGAIKPVIGWYEQGSAAPRFTSKDLARLRASVVRIEGRDDVPVIVLELAPAAVKELAKWEGDVQDRKHYFEIRVGQRVVATTKDSYFVVEERPERSIGGVTLDELCTAPAKRAVPAGLD